MPANQFPIYPLVPRVVVGAVGGAANTNYDGTGTLEDAFTGAGTLGSGNGSFCDRLYVTPQGACPQTKITVFWYDGTLTKFIKDIECEAVGSPTTTEEIGAQIDVLAAIGFPDGVQVPAGHIIKLGSTVYMPNGYSRIAIGGDF